MPKVLEGRVVLVTGGGRGLGRAYALELAAQGASVVVDVLADRRSADEVVDAITAGGGSALAVQRDVSSEAEVEAMFAAALAEYGAVHAVVNNAGFVRDKMLVNMGVEDWDAIMGAHLRGTFLVTRTAARYWRDQSKLGIDLKPRVVNTVSAAGLFGNVGQANYGAAKAGISTFTLIAATELKRYGITVNALSPAARTEMTAALLPQQSLAADDFDVMNPANVAPLVAWLCSASTGEISGHTFSAMGGRICVNEGWHDGPALDLGRRWSPEDVAREIPLLLAQARPATPVLGSDAASTASRQQRKHP